MNPSSTPALSITIEREKLKMVKGGAEVAMQFIVAEKMSLYNRESSACTHYEDLNSSFYACVVGNTVSKIGCKVLLVPKLNGNIRIITFTLAAYFL